MLNQITTADLRALRVFRCIAECGSFSNATNILNVSESTISSQISNFENRLGFKLCTRGRVGFQLTDRGRVVLDEYSMFNITIDNFRQTLNSLSDTTVGSLRVGILDHTITEKGFSTVKLISKFIEKAPNVELHLIQDIQSKLLRAIIDGRIDVAIGAFDTKNELIKSKFLYSERQHLYYSNKHPFFHRSSNQPTLEEIKSADRVSRGYQLDPFDKLPIKDLNSSATAANIESVLVLILAGKHIGYMPAHFAKKHEERGQLYRLLPRKLSVKVDISIILRSNTHETLAMKKFAGICKSLV